MFGKNCVIEDLIKNHQKLHWKYIKAQKKKDVMALESIARQLALANIQLMQEARNTYEYAAYASKETLSSKEEKNLEKNVLFADIVVKWVPKFADNYNLVGSIFGEKTNPIHVAAQVLKKRHELEKIQLEERIKELIDKHESEDEYMPALDKEYDCLVYR